MKLLDQTLIRVVFALIVGWMLATLFHQCIQRM